MRPLLFALFTGAAALPPGAAPAAAEPRGPPALGVRVAPAGPRHQPPPLPRLHHHGLADDGADAQDEASGVEWVSAAELQRRMAALQADGIGARTGASVGGAAPRPGRRRLAPVPVTLLGPLTGNVSDTANNAGGPAFPVFADDVPVDLRDTFGVRVARTPPDTRFAVPQVPERGCNAGGAQLNCGQQLVDCLARDIGDSDSICGCYLAYGQCYKSYGCVELLPTEDVQYCFSTLHCTLDQCEGNGAGWAQHGVAAPLIAAAVVGSALLLLLAGGHGVRQASRGG